MPRTQIIFCGFFILFMTCVMGAKKEVGKIIEASGDAKVAHGLKKVAAKVGDPVYNKTKVKTKADGKIVITMESGDVLTIGPNTYTKIEKKGSSTRLAQYSGQLSCKVNKLKGDSSFTVKTPSAVAGVRGTDFDNFMDPSTMTNSTVTTEGSVWNAAPENEGQLQQELSKAKSNDGNSGGTPNNPASDLIKVTNANQASVTTADGATIVTEFNKADGGNPADIAKKAMSNAQNDGATEILNEQQLSAEQDAAERLQTLEERLQSIEEASATEVLPGPPSRPE